jgi:membrane protease YdiL (CAAX protease family)
MLDFILASYLLFVLPGTQLWKSLRAKKSAPEPPVAAARKARFFKNLLFILMPVIAMAVLLAWSGRGPGAIGLDIPVSTAGRWGLFIIALLFVAGWVGTLIWERTLNEEKTAKYHADLRALEHIPKTRNELWGFLLLTICMGIGWELLYRGFLMLVLPPLTGTAGAVILSAVAYGVGHGYSNPKQFVGSIVSAFLFTIAYVLTNSLWWLMLLHVLLPLLGICTAYIALNKAPRTAAV